MRYIQRLNKEVNKGNERLNHALKVCNIYFHVFRLKDKKRD